MSFLDRIRNKKSDEGFEDPKELVARQIKENQEKSPGEKLADDFISKSKKKEERVNRLNKFKQRFNKGFNKNIAPEIKGRPSSKLSNAVNSNVRRINPQRRNQARVQQFQQPQFNQFNPENKADRILLREKFASDKNEHTRQRNLVRPDFVYQRDQIRQAELARQREYAKKTNLMGASFNTGVRVDLTKCGEGMLSTNFPKLGENDLLKLKTGLNDSEASKSMLGAKLPW